MLACLHAPHGVPSFCAIGAVTVQLNLHVQGSVECVVTRHANSLLLPKPYGNCCRRGFNAPDNDGQTLAHCHLVF